MSMIPPGKTRCYITAKLRPDTPEESVRQRVARSLVREYGYKPSDIELSFTVPMGVSKKQADIVVFKEGKPHKVEYIHIIAETKREKIKPTDHNNGLGQLHSYLWATDARWGLWVGSELHAYEMTKDGSGGREPQEVSDIPLAGTNQIPRIHYGQLVPAENLKDVFRRCHNYIYANQGMPKDQAFHELLKIIFCKVQDERLCDGPMRLDITNEERTSELGQRRMLKRIEDLFDEVKDEYPYIFKQEERIELDKNVLAYIIHEMRRFSLTRTSNDIKGEAYQEIVRENLRGDRGEFFTLPTVCRMATEMAFSRFPKNRWQRLRVLDPACGTGGFLRAVINFWRDDIEAQMKGKHGTAVGDAVLSEISTRIRTLCDAYLFGIDISPQLVRTAQMNLVMHGDGSTNALRANSLESPSAWGFDPNKVGLGKFDIILTNPPFGAGPGLKIDDPHILEQYELSKFENNGKLRSGMPPEQLFIERCWQFLKPGTGVMAIVLPDSILSNPGLAFLRRWILKRCKVLASIDLPVETFLAFSGTGTQTSVLLLERKTKQQMDLEESIGQQADYEVFMSIPRTVGYDRRGNNLWMRTPEGDEILQEKSVPIPVRSDGGMLLFEHRIEAQRVKDDEVAEVSTAYRQWLEERAT